MSIGNEPAYPVSEEIERTSLTNGYGGTGLTKRELFAAMAMQGLLTKHSKLSSEFDSRNYPSNPDKFVNDYALLLSVDATRYADALLTQLSKEPGHE